MCVPPYPKRKGLLRKDSILKLCLCFPNSFFLSHLSWQKIIWWVFSTWKFVFVSSNMWVKEATNKFMAPGQDEAQGQIPPSVTSKSLSGALGMAGVTQNSWSWPELGQQCPGEQDQGQVHDLGDSQADSLWGQPVAWAVSSLSVGASRDFSVPGHQRGDYNQLSHRPNW